MIKNEIDKQLNRINSPLNDRDFYMGQCYDASDIALRELEKKGYEYKKAVCYLNKEDLADHCVIYKKIKKYKGRPYLSGVIDFTAIQFHDEPGLEDYQKEFKKYKYGEISDKHSRKHYSIYPKGTY